MLNYVGVKFIKATPMDLKTYNEYRGWTQPDGEENAPGYLVEYAPNPESELNHPNHEGYISWSPKHVFEEAYRATSTGISFGLAIQALKRGRCVARKGWNGKDMFVCKQVPSEIYCNIIPKMSSLPKDAKKILYNRDKSLFYQNQMIIVKPDNTIDSWVPSSSDIFANDWFVIE